MRLLEWYNNLLKRHNLTQPDGRALYQYQLSNEEFAELVQLLKLSTHLGLANISRDLLAWNAVFVMYGAEWWRREYRGGPWSWKGIFASIGLDVADLSINRRNQLIESGLQQWKRELRTTNGWTNYLGSIAVEGGLPLSHLAESGGWLQRVINPSLKKHLKRNIDPYNLVESYSDFIPETYRRNEIYQILADIIGDINRLRKEYALGEKENPVDWLEKNVQGWRLGFPLPLDDDVCVRLLNDLVQTIADVTEEAENQFCLERNLVLLAGAPRLVSTLELPPFVSLDSLMADEAIASLPSRMDIELYSSSGARWMIGKAYVTQRKGKSALKLSGKSKTFDGEDATIDLGLRFTCFGETLIDLPLSNGDALDHNEVWVFRDDDSRCSYIGSASQDTRDEQVIVYVPESLQIDPENEDTIYEELDCLFSGKLYRLMGDMRCSTDSGHRYKVSTAQAKASNVEYSLSGKRFPYKSVPGHIYIGPPQLVVTDVLNGTSQKMKSTKLMGRAIRSDDAWKRLDELDPGYHEVRLFDESGNIRYQRKIGLFPGDFQLKLLSTKNPLEGSIEFQGIPDAEVNCDLAEIRFSVTGQEDGYNVGLAAKELPPLDLPISLKWPGKRKELLLNIPFPSSGALLFDQNGQKLNSGCTVFFDQMHGHRIKLFSDKVAEGQKVSIQLKLVDQQLESARDLYINHSLKTIGSVTEWALIDWSDSIRNLMSVSSNLDAHVELTLSFRGSELLTIRVRHFHMLMEMHDAEGLVELQSTMTRQVSFDVLEHTQVQALRLNQPEQTLTTLEPVISESVRTGCWYFVPERRAAGPWLIIPSAESQIQFRALLWNVGDTDVEHNTDVTQILTLQRAIHVANPVLRAQAIHHVLDLMAHDLEHKGWDYLKSLRKQTAHLPLSTFDIWSVCIRNTKFLAALVVKRDEKLVGKLSGELPIAWELVRLADWRLALAQYKDSLKSALDDEEMANTLLEKRISQLGEVDKCTELVAKILEMEFLGKPNSDLASMSSAQASVIVKMTLDNEIQGLMRRNADRRWPQMLTSQLKRIYSNMPEQLRSLIDFYDDYRVAVILAPLVAAERALNEEEYGWVGESTSIFKLKQLKSFDDVWFNAVFDVVYGFWSQQKKLAFCE